MYERIRAIEFELSTTCNSFCPTCVRYTVHNNTIVHNPNVKINQNIQLGVFKKILQDPIVEDNVRLILVGTAGEPVAHPDFLEIIDLIKEIKPNAYINIYTNGGLRTTDFFKTLAIKLQQFKKYKFSFAIDGLEDTNHIYRREVKWDKVISNLTAFITAGGRADWKFVVFPWNIHQIDQARKFALDLGCVAFETRENYVPELDNHTPEILNYPIDKKIKINNFLNNKEQKIPDYDVIDPVCVNEDRIFVAPEGDIYPCCMFHAAKGSDNQFLYFKKVYSSIDNINIKKSTLTGILEDNWWSELKNNIDNNPCELCVINCGMKNNEK